MPVTTLFLGKRIDFVERSATLASKGHPMKIFIVPQAINDGCSSSMSLQDSINDWPGTGEVAIIEAGINSCAV